MRNDHGPMTRGRLLRQNCAYSSRRCRCECARGRDHDRHQRTDRLPRLGRGRCGVSCLPDLLALRISYLGSFSERQCHTSASRCPRPDAGLRLRGRAQSDLAVSRIRRVAAGLDIRHRVAQQPRWIPAGGTHHQSSCADAAADHLRTRGTRRSRHGSRCAPHLPPLPPTVTFTLSGQELPLPTLEADTVPESYRGTR